MNDTLSGLLHGLITQALANPAIMWAGILACVAGAAIPWIVEATVPMEEWSGWKFRLATYGIAMAAGMFAAVTVWHSWSAFAMWVPALGINLARDLASHFLPWLSPRQQIVVRRNEQGQVVAIKEGDDPTIFIKPGDKP